MRCIDCLYFYARYDDSFEHCQFEPRCAGDLPPCEEEDGFEDEDDW